MTHHGYEPMLASKMSGRATYDWKQWVGEVKENGVRVLIHVGVEEQVRATTRPKGDGRVLERVLPEHLVAALRKLHPGIYDAELVVRVSDQQASTDVTRKDMERFREVALFDVLQIEDKPVVFLTAIERRQILESRFAELRDGWTSPIADLFGGPDLHVRLVERRELSGEEDVTNFFAEVRERGGEGLILKRRDSLYHSGLRSKEWVKLKRKEHATLVITGFSHTRGEKLDRGPFAIVHLKDEDGNETTVKTRNDHELRQFEKEWDNFVASLDPVKHRTALYDALEHPGDHHPAIGRRLVIEFQQRTRTGGYAGPVIWDHWAADHED